MATAPSATPRSSPQAAPRPDLIARPPEGLYVHFPFCVSLCPYCDFVVYAGAAARGPRARVDAFLAALHRELGLRADALDKRFGPLGDRPTLSSVYLGGGTPSLMAPDQVAGLLEAVRHRFRLAADAEVTLEANPGADELGDLPGFVAAGVSRLSLGAQSMDPDELRRLGRRHTPGDVEAAVRLARQAGFASVSLDLLTDIPGQTTETWGRSLDASLAFGVDHLSVYSLSLDDPDAEGLTGVKGDHLPVRGGARRWRDRARAEQSQERAAEMETMADAAAADVGLHRYEIANLARGGHESRHNRLYWQRRPYAALGPGAHDSDGALLRTWNAARLDGYLAALDAGRLPPGGTELVDVATARAERAILGLRMAEGIAEDIAEDIAVEPGPAAALSWAGEHGLVESAAGRFRLTQQGRLLANEVFVRLLPATSTRSA